MKTHSNDHMMTTTTNTTAAVMMAMCGMFSRRAHSFWRPLGFLLVFLYFLQIFCRAWSTVATSTDTSAICVKLGVSFICPFQDVIQLHVVKVKQHRNFV